MKDIKLLSNMGKVKWILLFILIVAGLGKLLSILVHPGEVQPPASAGEIPVVKTIQDENDQMIAVIRAQELERQQYNEIIDSLSQALRLKKSQVITVDRYIMRTDTVVVKHVEYTRSVDSVRFYKKDAYLELLAVGKDTGLSYLQLRHTDTLFRTEVIHKPLLKAAYSEVYLRNASPYSRITHGSSFLMKEHKPLITIGPYAGYDVVATRISVGVSIQLPLVTVYRKR